MGYQLTVGLEIHVELKTRTKMFCGCPAYAEASAGKPNDSLGEDPNVNVCPICLGHPGTLPVPNKKAIESVLKVGLALGGKPNPITKFDRKNYFYPDLPKAYQISQYDQPLIEGGELLGVKITRIHLEEDTARLAHQSGTEVAQGGPSTDSTGSPQASSGQRASLVDFNRSGVPLMELVTEPDIHSPEQVAAFGRELQLILRYLGVSDADMEKGQLRVEPNISIAPVGSTKLGNKVEVKNINSFRAAQDATAFEFKRQREVIEGGGKISQENRGWDDVKRITVSQRSKEDAHDYRYFPEPDIPPFETSAFNLDELRASISELPQAKRERFTKEYSLSPALVDGLVAEPALAGYFEAAASELGTEVSVKSYANLANYLTSDLRGLLNETGTAFGALKIKPEGFADLVALIETGKIMSRQAKDILRIMFETGDDPHAILEREGLETVSDTGEIGKVVVEVLIEQPKAVADLRAGKEVSLQFLVGQAMKKLKGRGNPEVLKEEIKKQVE